MQKLWSPVFEELIKILPDCAQGFVQIAIMCLDGLDEAFKCKDTRALSIWFKIYPTLFNMVLPFFDDGSLKDAMAKGVADAKKTAGTSCKRQSGSEINEQFLQKTFYWNGWQFEQLSSAKALSASQKTIDQS